MTYDTLTVLGGPMSHNFDIDTIKKVALLARLTIKPEELPSYSETLSKILALVEQINKADTTDITPMAHPFAHSKQLMRPDEITEVLQPALLEELKEIAPLMEAGLYLVPIPQAL